MTWLTAYLDECGRDGGKPLTGPALERFLPWNASREDLRTWAQPPPAGQTRTNNAVIGMATEREVRTGAARCGLAEGSALSGNVPGTVRG